MKSKPYQIIILFTFISLAALFLILWLVDYSDFGIPEMIPQLQLRTYGILILAAFVLLFILLQKRLLALNINTPVSGLVISSTIVAFTSLLLYQTTRQCIIPGVNLSTKLTSILLASAGPALVLLLMAAMIASDLKKIKGIRRHIPTIVLLILLILTRKYLHQFDW
jgi:hypothetical protein